MIAAEAEAMGLGAALVVGVEMGTGGIGIGEEARVGGRAVRYRSGTTGPMKAIATHGLLLSRQGADVPPFLD